MKRSFNFLRWLTKRDIKTILDKFNFELFEETINFKSIQKVRKNGQYHIIVCCRLKNVSIVDRLNQLFNSSAEKKYLDIDNYNFNNVELEFSQFELREISNKKIKTKEQAEQLDKKLTYEFTSYMEKKFGKFYRDKKTEYLKSLDDEDSYKLTNK